MTDERQNQDARREQDAEAPSEKRRERVFIPLRIDRRSLIRGGGVTVAAATLGGAVEAQDERSTPEASEENQEQYSELMPRPEEIPSPDELKVLSKEQAETVDALTSRILPGDADDPGAHEAGVVVYIDNLLAYQEGIGEVTYRSGPFAKVYDPNDGASATPGASPAASPAASPGASPVPPPNATPEQLAEGSPIASPPADSDEVVWVSQEDIERYGYQSRLTPLEVYTIGLAAVDRYANGKHGKRFADLSGDQQDEIVGAMANGDIKDFDPDLTAQSFFQNLRRHTSEGMFSDPAYGGNRDMVGWKLVGYPGAQRAYNPWELQQFGTDRQPQSMAQMAAFNPGHQAPGRDDAVLPVSGSGEPATDENEQEREADGSD